MKVFRLFALLIMASALVMSCNKDDDEPTEANLNLSFDGLQDLGDDFVYEGWIIVDGNAMSAGIFRVTDKASILAIRMDRDILERASAYVLTIEPYPDPDPAPSKVHILAGDFSKGKADLTVAHSAALGNDFTGASGYYILATPTTTDDQDEESGLWFLNNSSGSPAVGLDLPTLPEGWMYEGWAVINGTPVSTGKFTDPNGADDFSGHSGPNPGPPFPGEDFITDAPPGLTFPTDLTGGAAVISIEPYPDNSADPFVLKPLFHNIPADANVHSVYMLDNNAAATNPSGSATIE